MYGKLQKQKGFTLIELVVAIAILGVILATSGMIFKITIETQRTALANAEIMQKFRAISMQLDSDFQDIQKDAPLTVWFHSDPNRYDKIMFFASGDFQSTQRYYYEQPSSFDNKPVLYDDEELNQGMFEHASVRGNIARIYYGHANIRDTGGSNPKRPWELTGEDIRQRILARRRHILTANPDFVEWPDKDLNKFNYPDPDPSLSGVSLALNERYEHDSLSIPQWKNFNASTYDKVLNTTFTDYVNSWIDLSLGPASYREYSIHNLMCEGVGSFGIQWAYWDDSSVSMGRIRWFPMDDLDGEKFSPQPDSQFKFNKKQGSSDDWFGVVFEVEGKSTLIDNEEVWKKVEHLEYENVVLKEFASGFYPKALKFTIKIYDSKGIIKEGRTFTKIIYLGN
ncbi:MAG: PulJ/GspJ family protein [Planctomycetota bacterium]|jgi:prepilin-type N-terminal cleavage/methylation domain-containing protein